MARNSRLADIYVKLSNKRPITLGDLEFLEKCDYECFEKTCKNLVYKDPEMKQLMQKKNINSKQQQEMDKQVISEEMVQEEEISEQEKIANLLENLRKMEGYEFGVQKTKADNVKQLLGSLYMELMFPHNDKEKTLLMKEQEEYSGFDQTI